MTHLSRNFNALGTVKAAEKKYPPPFSLRLTHEERARLDAERGNKPLSVHIRERLFMTIALRAPVRIMRPKLRNEREKMGLAAGAASNPDKIEVP